jgi:hypothetical protein
MLPRKIKGGRIESENLGKIFFWRRKYGCFG